MSNIVDSRDIFSIFFRSIHFLIPQSFICISRNDTFVFDVFGFLFLFTERFPTPVMQCRFPEVFEYRKVWRDLSGSTQIVVDDQMQVIRIRDAYPSYSLNSDGSGSQEVKLVMRCRTSHGTGGVQKFVVHTTTSEWYFHLKITHFFPYTSKLKKNLWCLDKSCTLQSKKNHTNEESTFLYIRKKGMIGILSFFFWLLQHLHTICNSKRYHMLPILYVF